MVCNKWNTWEKTSQLVRLVNFGRLQLWPWYCASRFKHTRLNERKCYFNSHFSIIIYLRKLLKYILLYLSCKAILQTKLLTVGNLCESYLQYICLLFIMVRDRKCSPNQKRLKKHNEQNTFRFNMSLKGESQMVLFASLFNSTYNNVELLNL